MKTQRIYRKICIVCGDDFECKQAIAKTCGQSCRNALSIGRKLQDIPDGVITAVSTPVITPESNVTPKEINQNRSEQNILTIPMLKQELLSQNLNSDKGDIYCHLFYKYIAQIYSSTTDKNKVEILPGKLKDFGFNFKNPLNKITLGEYNLILKYNDPLSLMFLLTPHYIVEKNKELSVLMEN